jgi:hypothetical protein
MKEKSQTAVVIQKQGVHRVVFFSLKNNARLARAWGKAQGDRA